MSDRFDYRMLERSSRHLLARIENGVFDNAIDEDLLTRFLEEASHHMVLAIDREPDGGTVVGMASAVDYVHPDKKARRWINEVGVAVSHRRRGIATAMIETLLAHARAREIHEIWLATEASNHAACALYESMKAHAEVCVMYSFCDWQSAASAGAARP